MSVTYERHVADRFDALVERFDSTAEPDDLRLVALRSVLPPLDGLRILDVGCGKGRLAVHLRDEGAEVVGLDPSAAMLGRAKGLDRVRATARRLPFAWGTFDATIAVESLAHVPAEGLDSVLDEMARVLRPGGVAAILDKNALALNAKRPWLPALAVKWIDERRGRWMYPAGGPVRETWFRPDDLLRRLGRSLDDPRASFLLSPDEADRPVFRRRPGRRLLVLWTARKPGGRDG